MENVGTVKLEENTLDYYQQPQEHWQTKEQLIIGNEVAPLAQKSGTIDTADTTLTKIDNVFRLSVANPDGKIFSMTINGQSKTFMIGFFWNSALAYSTLETELQTWLWVDYIVNYDTGTFFNISRVDGTAITYSNPNLVRNIALSGWNEHARIDIIIDGTTYSILGTSYATSTLALDYLVTTLTGSTYFVTRESTNLVIARKDGAIPTITKTQYNRYTYNITGRDSTLWPTSADLWGSNWSTDAKAYRSRVTIWGITYTYTLSSGITWSTIDVTYTASNPSFWSWDIRNTDYRWSALVDYFYSQISWTYTTSNFSYTSISWTDRDIFSFDFYNSNRTQHLKTNFEIDYVKDSWLGIVTSTDYNWVDLIETNNLADITVTTYTEISKTFTTLSNNFYIPTYNIPNTIRITAVSSVGNSTGEYKRREQSCTAKYGTTTEVVADKIFKTNASNFWNIVLIKRWGFVINWTTNTSNKLDYVCE